MNHIAEVKGIKETETGTMLSLFIPNTYLETQIERQGGGNKDCVEIRLSDSRIISAEQRRKYWASINDIAKYTGHLTEFLHDYMKMKYRYHYSDEHISMSDCTVTEARQMITLVIDFILDNNIPLSEKIINRVEDVDRYLYRCIVKRLCIVDGRANSDFHHTTAVGMGRDRTKIDHVGMEGFTLCRSCHTIIHQVGEKEFCDKHKVYPLTLDEYAVKKLKL